jgi:hypothetical protein
LNGIPIGADHQASLCEIANALGIATPFAEFAERRIEDGEDANRPSMVRIVRRIAQTAKTRLFG